MSADSRLRFKLEIAGTEQEILAAYMRYAQEHRDPMMDGWGSGRGAAAGRLEYVAHRMPEIEGCPPPIPAATVVIVRDGLNGVEVLMLHRSDRIGFGECGSSRADVLNAVTARSGG